MIGYPTKRRILTRTQNQAIYFSCVLFYCSSYSIIIPFCFDLINQEVSKNQTFSTNETNNSGSSNSSYMNCNFVSYEAQEIASYLDLANRQLIPMILMIVFSCLLVSVINKSRSRVASSKRQQNRLDRDVKQTEIFIKETSEFMITSTNEQH